MHKFPAQIAFHIWGQLMQSIACGKQQNSLNNKERERGRWINRDRAKLRHVIESRVKAN